MFLVGSDRKNDITDDMDVGSLDIDVLEDFVLLMDVILAFFLSTVAL